MKNHCDHPFCFQTDVLYTGSEMRAHIDIIIRYCFDDSKILIVIFFTSDRYLNNFAMNMPTHENIKNAQNS